MAFETFASRKVIKATWNTVRKEFVTPEGFRITSGIFKHSAKYTWQVSTPIDEVIADCQTLDGAFDFLANVFEQIKERK